MSPVGCGTGAAILILSCALAGTACATQGGTPPNLPPDLVPAGTVLGGGAIVGRVVYRGPVDTGEPIAMRADPWCHHSHPEPHHKDDLVVHDGGVSSVFVRIASGIDRKFAPPAEPVTLDQRGCLYRPRLIGLQVGQPLRLLNSDATLHNVHTTSQSNPAFNLGMTLQGQEVLRYFGAEEIMIPVRCNVHPWMAAFIGVLWHPFFAVTREEGTFAIRNLPPGDYVVEAWHERLGTLKSPVALGPDETAEIVLEYLP